MYDDDSIDRLDEVEKDLEGIEEFKSLWWMLWDQ